MFPTSPSDDEVPNCPKVPALMSTAAILKSFRTLSDLYRYPRTTYVAKFAIIAAIVIRRAGF